MKSKEFNALIIDASTDNLYVMLLSQGEVLGGKSCDSIKKHSETVMTEIDRVLKLGGLKLGDVYGTQSGNQHGKGLERASRKKTCCRQYSGNARIQ